MKLLVTGGAGFIGSNFIRLWINHHPHDQIINLDKLTYAGNLDSLKDIADKSNYHFVQGDICDSKLVNKLVKKTDVVIHFAAESHVDRSIDNPAVFVKTNVLGTQVLLEAALRYKIKRFHHISTDEVFGELSLNSRKKFNEKTSYNPRSPYSASKAGADYLVRSFWYTYQLPVTISNGSNNYGPYQHPEKFIPRMITNLIDGKKIPIYGDGLYVRDWLYVEDHCRAIEKILLKGRAGETYCLGGLKKDVSNLTLAKMVLKIMDRDENNWLEFIKDRSGHDRRYAVDWTKAKKELGWQPEHNLGFWLKKTIDWYQNNQWWWRPLKKEAEDFYKKASRKGRE